ncbi:MAG: chorismate mutase [Candidatus Methanoperedenaceae archaeon]|nr:chorismate mutase [Candidatus Methanoperedenaceae archaeon]MDW7726017.1 chorismate mutase [Candidatus Methanoperedens sp.]
MPLKELRAKIEKLDIELIDLIKIRTELAKDVLDAKKEEGRAINDVNQNRVVLDRVANASIERGLDGEQVRRIFEILIRMNIERQHELSGEGNLP